MNKEAFFPFSWVSVYGWCVDCVYKKALVGVWGLYASLFYANIFSDLFSNAAL